MSKIFIPSVAGGCALAMVAAVGFASTNPPRTVNLTVDGHTSQVRVKANSVGTLLQKQGVQLGAHDVVMPSVDSPVTNGMDVTVLVGRPLTLTLDGVTKKLWITATNVEQALRLLAVDSRDVKLSTSRSAGITREGMTLEVSRPKDVTVLAGGQRSSVRVAGTVQDVLDQRKITVDNDDIITPALSTHLTDGMEIRVVKVEHRNIEKTLDIPFEKKTVKTAELTKGIKRVTTKGVPGKKLEKYAQVLHDGKVISEQLLSSDVKQKPVTEITSEGTRNDDFAVAGGAGDDEGSSSGGGSGAGLNLARAAMWDRIAQCESSGNWAINTGNGYYGGLQFDLSTWRSVRGQDFAAYPHQASRAEQITVANRLYAKRGLQPWGCRHRA